jgi:predicted nucleic acid-binding protein
MNTQSNRVEVRAAAQQTSSKRRKFRRVLVRRVDSSTHTTVCVTEAWYGEALRLAYRDGRKVSAALRRAALQVQDQRFGWFSRLVRAKAMASLRGSYQPAKAAALAAAAAAEARLAEENNASWSAVG